MDEGTHLEANLTAPLFAPFHTTAFPLPTMSSTIDLANSSTEPPLGPASPLAQRLIVSRMRVYLDDGGRTTVASLAWKGVVTVPTIMVTTLTLNGASSTRSVSEIELSAALEEAYAPVAMQVSDRIRG